MIIYTASIEGTAEGVWEEVLVNFFVLGQFVIRLEIFL